MKQEIERIFEISDLVPAIVQNDDTNEVLQLAYMNREALVNSIETGTTWFFSRSRGRLWNKGETVCAILVDADSDALLVRVKPLKKADSTEPIGFTPLR